jgi:hypothetical protein
MLQKPEYSARRLQKKHDESMITEEKKSTCHANFKIKKCKLDSIQRFMSLRKISFSLALSG